MKLEVVFILFVCSHSVRATIKRCFNCRSRGDLGSCKDKFAVAISKIEEEPGIQAVPCASGWCGKVIETSSANLKVEEEYGTATQRMCLQRPPSDMEERCDDTLWGYRKVFMCFCKGDLCNNAIIKSGNIFLLTFLVIVSSCMR